MFRKLRNRLILINLGITTVVIVTVFTFIYVLSTQSAKDRPPMIQTVTFSHTNGNVQPNEEVEQIVMDSLHEEKKAAAKDLLVVLVASGIAIEILVAIISYFLAEEAIKPVKEAYESQKIFIANASHEIKTPLAAISANLEAADIKNNKWISNVERETEKLTTLNGELLALARTDLITEATTHDEDLTKILHELIETHTPRMKNLHLTKKIILPKKTRINREDFVQVVNILLDNAIKYADKKIILEAKENKLLIKNDGAKIPEKDLPHIFERFYQTDKTAEGVGLGLAIAKTTADRNNWTLTAKSDKNYTTFTLNF